MGYWVHVDDPPTDGGEGRGSGPGWGEYLGCFGFWAVLGAIVYLGIRFGFSDVAAWGVLLLFGCFMLYMIIQSGFDRMIFLCGGIGFLLGLLISGFGTGFLFAFCGLAIYFYWDDWWHG